MVGSMAIAQGFGMIFPGSVFRACCSGELRQPAVIPGITFSRPSRIDAAVRFSRPSYRIGVFIDSQPGLISNFCTPQGAPYLKAGKRSTTTLGIFGQRRVCKGPVRCELGGASSFQEDEIGPDANVPSTSDGNDTVQFDLNLPRRSVLVEFTCNVCDARTQRMINPYALRRGTVYVQCGGCEKYHQLVDNLNLVEEYDFRNEVDPMRNDLGV